MNCDVIQDLIPLYIDGCCSEQSAQLVEAHTKTCSVCRKCLENAQKPLEQTEIVTVPKTSKISEWKASVLQSILFFVYFAIITVGVALEARTPSGLMNGFWAFNLVVPATGFLLSLVNWYFVRSYKSKKAFVFGARGCTLVASLVCCLFSAVHYALPVWGLLPMAVGYGCIGTVFFAMNLLLSGWLSNLYAKMVGKE